MHLRHCQTLFTKIKRGGWTTKPMVTPQDLCETSRCFSKKGKGTRNTRPVLPVFSYIKNTRVWRRMWSCHDFLVYRIRLLKPGCRSDTSLPGCCVLGCVVQSRSRNGGFIIIIIIIMYMQRTSNSTRRGFNLPSDQFYECFKWPRCTEPTRLSPQKKKKRTHTKKKAYQSETRLVHVIVGFWIGVTAPHVSLLQRFVPLLFFVF